MILVFRQPSIARQQNKKYYSKKNFVDAVVVRLALRSGEGNEVSLINDNNSSTRSMSSNF